MTLVPASMLSASDLAYLGPTVTDLVRSKRALHGRSRRDLHHLDPAVWLAKHYDLKPAEIRELMRVSSLALVDRYTGSLKVTRSLADAGPKLEPDDQGNPQKSMTVG
ncbi:MAG: hypothetical protein GC164_15445 [Phycisphaera sp.]|nr:hypothetical protein [Phycisphaera sp.]